MRISVFACALLAAACGGSEDRPAQSPSSTTLTEAQSTTSTTAAVPARATTSQRSSDAENVADAPSPMTATSPPASTPSDATVANDPGAHDQTKNADNTKINDRDRHDTLTPVNQGSSGAETKITAAIRRELMKDTSLSFTAKNVKIITVGTKVTLRGPVNTDQEKAAIEACAKKAAGVTDVDDQLEVKK